MNEQHGLTVEVEADSEMKADDEGVAILLFQSVRELLFNVAKHAEVKKAQVRMNRLDDDRIRIVVADEGVGFDAARQAAGGSTYGFGLFSIRERIESLGGRLEIESARGRGTRITMTVPIRRIEISGQRAPTLAGEPISAISPEAYSPPSAPASAVTRRIRVLLVDDHMIVRQGLARLLQSEDDIEVAGEAADGQSAVELARQLLPDVVVMDVSMPVMSGIEATRIITAELPFVKVIGLSIYHEADTAAAMREAGAVAYLNKGGRSQDLLTAIRGQRPADWPN
jgi:CheY-like chemotaxis protein